MSTPPPDNPQTNKKVYPALIAVLYIVCACALAWLLPLPYHVPLPLSNAGFGLVVVGFLFGVAALVEFRKARTTSNPHGSVRALVTGGIYKFTRNPIYLGFLFMVIGLPLNMGTYWGVVVAPLFIVSMNKLVIHAEEDYLAQKFPKEYAEYTARVRRWL